MRFPEYRTKVDIQAFRYQFMYNDYWLDYDRLGAIVGAEHEFLPRLFVHAIVGYYNDSYPLPGYKQGGCSYVPRDLSSDTGESTDPDKCIRKDTGLMYQAGVYWNYSQFSRLELMATYIENQNPGQRVYDSTNLSVLLTGTVAFPDVAKVLRFTDRFADTAFAKQAQWTP